MGGSSSKSKEVVGIRWNKPIYLAGETASGTIEMNIAAPAGWPAASVQLTISGEEKTHVVYQTTHTSGSGDQQTTTTTTHHAHAKRPLFNLSVEVAQVPGGYLGPGQYSWPFTATLPEGLPSTMAERSPSGGWKVAPHVPHRPGRRLNLTEKPVSGPEGPFSASPVSTGLRSSPAMSVARS